MLKTSLNCSPSCQLRDICRPSASPGARTRPLGDDFRQFCNHTRWLLIAGLALPVAALAAVGVKLLVA